MIAVERRDNIVVASSYLVLASAAMIVISPAFLHFPQTSAVLNYIVAGLVICILAAMRVFVTHRAAWLSLASAVVGAWVMIFPFLLGFWHYPWTFWTSTIFGAAVVLFSIWAFWASLSDSFDEDAMSQ